MTEKCRACDGYGKHPVDGTPCTACNKNTMKDTCKDIHNCSDRLGEVVRAASLEELVERKLVEFDKLPHDIHCQNAMNALHSKTFLITALEEAYSLGIQEEAGDCDKHAEAAKKEGILEGLGLADSSLEACSLPGTEYAGGWDECVRKTKFRLASLKEEITKAVDTNTCSETDVAWECSDVKCKLHN